MEELDIENKSNKYMLYTWQECCKNQNELQSLINKQRKERGFSVRSVTNSLLLRYAEELGLGVPRKTILKKMRN